MGEIIQRFWWYYAPKRARFVPRPPDFCSFFSFAQFTFSKSGSTQFLSKSFSVVAGTQDQILRPFALVGADVVFCPYCFISIVKVILDAGFFASLERSVAAEDDAVVLGILVPQGNEFLQLIGIVLGEVVCLRRVGLEVEQLPFAGAAGGTQEVKNLPVTPPDRAVAEHFPPNPVAVTAHGLGLAGEQWNQRLALQWGDLAIRFLRRMFRAGQFIEGGRDVHDMKKGGVDAAGLLDAGTGDDEGRTDAALGHIALEHPERHGTCLRPGRAVVHRRAFLAPVLRSLVEVFHEPLFGIGGERRCNQRGEFGGFRAIVREEDHQRVVELPASLR